MHHPSQKRARPGGKTTNELRIIGGQWRGRKLKFPSVDGLRPTPDRVRETLFNWLAPWIAGAHCADLFAGSGALGFEALSRGAASVTWLDTAQVVTQQLRDNLGLLNARGNVQQLSALEWLQQSSQQRFDVVFVDPPFASDLMQPAIEQLAASAHLAADAWVYIETARDAAAPVVPAQWSLHREKHAGQVSYRLYHVSAGQ